jgi:hypothetical protein
MPKPAMSVFWEPPLSSEQPAILGIYIRQARRLANPADHLSYLNWQAADMTSQFIEKF